MPTSLLQGSYGVQKSTLDQITATAGNVQSGVKFLDKNGNIQTGTLSLSGNAGTGDVKSGKTFYSNSFTKKTGTLALTGNASVGNVLTGKTFYSNSWTKQTGTMANRGAVSKSLNPGGSYTIPAGYHNGSGKVTASSGSFSGSKSGSGQTGSVGQFMSEGDHYETWAKGTTSISLSGRTITVNTTLELYGTYQAVWNQSFTSKKLTNQSYSVSLTF